MEKKKNTKKIIGTVVDVLIWVLVVLCVGVSIVAVSAGTNAKNVPTVGSTCFLNVKTESMDAEKPAGVPADMQNGEIEVSLYDQIWQAGTILLSTVRSVGVMGDERTYEHPVALRAVTSTDAMTADWAHLPYDFMAKVSNEIINKVKGVNRVCYDISSKPPATIEWE